MAPCGRAPAEKADLEQQPTENSQLIQTNEPAHTVNPTDQPDEVWKQVWREMGFEPNLSQEEVDELSKYYGVDCRPVNRIQGYWGLNSLWDLGFTLPAFTRLLKWYLTSSAPALWWMWIIIWIVVNVMIALRDGAPYIAYILYAFVFLILLYVYLKWVYWIIRGGWRGWWEDVTREITYPGMVRITSLEYWTMAYACLFWFLFDYTGGGYMIWTFLLSPGPQMAYAVSCTMAAPHESTALGTFYILGAIVWFFVWLPAQMKWVDAKRPDGSTGAPEMGRGVGGEVNRNISFMTNSIKWVYLIITPEICYWAFSSHGLSMGWLGVQFVLPFIIIAMNWHMGSTALFFMGIAKLTANANRTGLDNYGFCFGTGW
jgi:hypothetical protein